MGNSEEKKALRIKGEPHGSRESLMLNGSAGSSKEF